MNSLVVVDAILAFKWLVQEGHSEKADDLGRLWASQGTRRAAPYFMPDHCGGALPVVLGPAGNAAPNRRAEETERQAWSPASGERGTGQGHRQRDSSPGWVGWVQPVRNRNAAVSGCGVGPDEQPAGPFSLDRTHHRRCRPFDGNCLLAPLAANSPRELTPAQSFWMQDLAAAVTARKRASPQTELCGTIGMWPSTFSAFATGYPPASKSTAHEYRSFPLRLIRNHEIPPPSLAS